MTKEWLKYRTTILGLYKDQSRTLDEVRRIMKEEYGFEASVRAYRSRFDKWRVHKYNCARRRAATVIAGGDYQPQEVHVCGDRGGHAQRPHDECQLLPVARHYSAPDVLVTQSHARAYTPHEPYPRPGIKPEPHVGHETSPGISAAGQGYPGQPYRPWFEPQGGQGTRGAATHQAPRPEAASSGPSSSSSSQYRTEQLHWIMQAAIQPPLQQHALKSLLQCLLCGPDVTRALPASATGGGDGGGGGGGEAPFSRLANIFWQQLSLDGTLGPEEVWELACECLRHLVVLGADPDCPVGGGDRPLLFRILEQPARTRAFGILWPLTLRLAAEASPVNHHSPECPNALHTLLLLRPPPANGEPRAPALAEAAVRAHLTKLLASRVAASGRLGDRNAAGLTALQQYVYHAAARDPPEYVLTTCAELVRYEGAAAAAAIRRGDGGAGGGRGAVLPSPVAELRAGRLPRGLNAHDGGGMPARVLPIAWTLACQLSLRGDDAAAEEYLGVAMCCVGGRAYAEGLRALMPRPAVAPIALPSPVSPSGDVKYAW